VRVEITGTIVATTGYRHRTREKHLGSHMIPVANARMYAVTPQVRDAWRALFDWAGRYSGVPLTYIDHAAPAPLEELWSRRDLAAAFMCGLPFAWCAPKPLIVAAPIPSPPRYRGQPAYCTDFVVRTDSGYRKLSDAFGGRIGWTVSHSQSGFNAVRHHLLSYRRGPERLFTQSIGPLVTPRKVIEAVADRVIDIGPLDSYVHDLLEHHEPATAAQLRTVESTAMTPIPPLIASPSTPRDTIERLRRALLASPDQPEAKLILDELLLSGFALVDASDYDRLLAQAREADTAGYPVPG
jgi:ABC-type phosphate/phosphonate transport system substrate-binding protein